MQFNDLIYKLLPYLTREALNEPSPCESQLNVRSPAHTRKFCLVVNMSTNRLQIQILSLRTSFRIVISNLNSEKFSFGDYLHHFHIFNVNLR